MSTVKTFGHGRAASRAKPYHYRACGLDDVYLLSGFTRKDTSYGPAISIKDIDGLHNAIASALIAQRAPLSPKEFRFLRKQIDMTQDELASRLRVDVQTVARYEKGRTSISGAADVLLRMLVSVRLLPNAARYKAVEAALETLEEGIPSGNKPAQPMHLEETRRGWKAREPAHS